MKNPFWDNDMMMVMMIMPLIMLLVMLMIQTMNHLLLPLHTCRCQRRTRVTKQQSHVSFSARLTTKKDKTFGKFLFLSTMLLLMRAIFTPRPLSSSVCYLGLEPRNTQRIISPPMMISIMHRAWKGSYGNLGNDVVEWLLVPFSAFVAKSLTHQWHHCMSWRSLWWWL